MSRAFQPPSNLPKTPFLASNLPEKPSNLPEKPSNLPEKPSNLCHPRVCQPFQPLTLKRLEGRQEHPGGWKPGILLIHPAPRPPPQGFIVAVTLGGHEPAGIQCRWKRDALPSVDHFWVIRRKR